MGSSLPLGVTILIKNKEFRFSFPQTAQEQMKGLAYRDDMDGYDGMLFDFGQSTRQVGMTPRGIKFALDVAFVDEAGTILEMAGLRPGFDFVELPDQPARYALEAPQGFFERNEIRIGDTIEIR